MAAEVLAEAQRRMQEAKDAKEATKQAASRKRQLTSVLAIAPNLLLQHKTLDEVYARKSKDEVDAAVLFSNGVSFHTTENPFFRTMLSAVGSFGPACKPPSRPRLRAAG